MATSTSALDGARVDLGRRRQPGGARRADAPGTSSPAIDGYRVLSTAELRTRLYADPPGTDLTLTYERAATVPTTPRWCWPTDGDAPAGGSAP